LHKVFTIGFTNSSAEHFFERLLSSGSQMVIDVRLHNTSQLAGFAKAADLAYFLKRLGGIEYDHQTLLAPEEEMLKTFKKEKGDWSEYEVLFKDLMASRKIENQLKPEYLAQSCLLCSEATPHRCHRRLILEYLNDRWGNILDVRHL
jgi:uncharacterized protein (DUF488 family)